MSRVDDDAQDRRVQERLALEKQRLEAKNKEKSVADSRFAKLVFKTGAEKSKSDEVRQNSTGRDVIDRMKGFGTRLQPQKAGGEEGKTQEQRTTDMAEGSRLTSAHTQDEDQVAGTMAGRKDDVRGGNERLEERKESQDNDAAAHLGAGQKAREDARAGAGGGGMGGGSNKDQQGDGQGAAGAQNFRLNPALMAPVAVAQPRTGAMSEKLRALANEIARHPQRCMRNDRLSAHEQWSLPAAEALANEFRRGVETIASGETATGAARFTSGAGRHGASS